MVETRITCPMPGCEGTLDGYPEGPVDCTECGISFDSLSVAAVVRDAIESLCGTARLLEDQLAAVTRAAQDFFDEATVAALPRVVNSPAAITLAEALHGDVPACPKCTRMAEALRPFAKAAGAISAPRHVPASTAIWTHNNSHAGDVVITIADLQRARAALEEEADNG